MPAKRKQITDELQRVHLDNVTLVPLGMYRADHHLPQGAHRHHSGAGDLLLEHQEEKRRMTRVRRGAQPRPAVARLRTLMWAYVVRRILATIPVLAIVALVVFSILHLAPGDPAGADRRRSGDRRSRSQAIRAKLGLDRPFHEQFAALARQRCCSGDLGISIFSNRPVTRAVPAAHRADRSRSRSHHDHHGPARRADRRDRRLAGRHGDRSRRDELRGARLLVPGVRDRLRADLHLRHQAEAVADPGLPPARRRLLAVPAPSHPAEPRARPELHGADRPHHARQRARGAEPGSHPHGARQGPAGAGSCCSTTPCPTPRCRSSPSSASASRCCSAASW